MENSTKDHFALPMEERTQSVSNEKWDTAYLDFNEDSISMVSNTSTVQSSFVRHRIQEHEMKKQEIVKDQIDRQHNQNNVVINFVLSADNSQNYSSPFVEVVNEILAQTKLPKKVESTTTSNWNIFNTNMRRPKYFISLFLLFFAFIGSTIGLYLILSENKAQSTDTTTSVVQLTTKPNVDKTTTTPTLTVSTTTKTTPTNNNTTHLVTTEPVPSTTEDISVDHNLVIITRDEWDAKPMTGDKKQSIPIKYVVFMQTYTDESCTTEEKCKMFIQNRQLTAYPEAKDIRENFLIGYNGNIYEGRGFQKEGEHTKDRGKTSYNRKAIGFSFIGNYANIEPNKNMFNKTNKFLQSSVNSGFLSSNYTIYHQQQLIGGTLEESLFNFTTKFENWKSSPRLVRRSEWGADLMGKYTLRSISKNVLISSTGGPSCNTKSDCIEVVKKMQIAEKSLLEDIAYNFIFGGDDLIFEGRSFDVMGNHTKYQDYDSIGILFIGNYNKNPPKPTLISKLLDEFLPYAINLAKLEPDYKIFAQRQCIANITSPGDSFFEIMKKWPHFDPEKQPTICQFGCITG